jgi:endonuclease YncB( thermonuclease family)
VSWRRAESLPRSRSARQPRSAIRRLLDLALAVAILALVAVIAARLDRVATRHLAGEAVINDGDTITLKGERIRLVGIDAPEYNQTCMKHGASYPCGRLSREALARLAKSSAVVCSGWERDRYRRLLAVCKAGGIDLNRRQVEHGWAVAWGDYTDAETLAREKQVGIWAGEFERPRDWRVEHGGMIEAEHDILGRIVNWLGAIFGFS